MSKLGALFTIAGSFLCSRTMFFTYGAVIMSKHNLTKGGRRGVYEPVIIQCNARDAFRRSRWEHRIAVLGRRLATLQLFQTQKTAR